MPVYAYLIDSETPFSESDRVLLVKEMETRFGARDIRMLERQVRFLSTVDPWNAEPILRDLSGRFVEMSMRLSTKLSD